MLRIVQFWVNRNLLRSINCLIRLVGSLFGAGKGRSSSRRLRIGSRSARKGSRPAAP